MQAINNLTKRIESVYVRNDANALTVINPESASSGSLTAVNQAVTIPVYDLPTVSLQVSGTFVGTVQFEGTLNGGDWVTLLGQQVGASVTTSTVTTVPQVYMVPTFGCVQVRARCSAYTSGTIAVVMRASYGLTQVSGNTSIATGSQLIGDTGIQLRATATGAASKYQLISVASTNASLVKASAGRVAGWTLSNTSAAWRYVKFHNSSTTPTAGAGVDWTIAIPPGSQVSCELPAGVSMGVGIGFTVVTGSATADATAVAAGDVVGTIFFA